MTKKKANGEGTIYWNKLKQRWIGQLSYEGRRVDVRGKSQQEVVQKIEERKQQLRIGIDVSGTLTLGSYLEEFLVLEENALAYVTWKGYCSLAENHLIPRLGRHRLNKLTPMHITTTWNKMMSDGVGVSTIQHCQSFLSHAINQAIGRSLMVQNPCNFATIPKLPHREITIIDENDVALFLNHTEVSDIDYHPFYHAAFQTGMRRGELAALQWRDVDLLGMQLQVNRSYGIVKNGYGYKPPKSGKGRSVDLTVGANLFLKDLKEQQLEMMTVNKDSHVFRYMHGTHPKRIVGNNITPDAATDSFKKSAVQIGMNNIHLHNARHSHAGLLLKMGTHPKVVQERLGHSSIQVTMDIYSHIAPNLQRDAIKDFPLFVESRL